MKRWNQPAAKPVETPVFQHPVNVDVPVVSFVLKCIGCLEICDVLYEGSSFCQTCLKEKLRRGV